MTGDLKLLASCDNFYHGREFNRVNAGNSSIVISASYTPRFGLSDCQIHDIWFSGAKERQIHAWVIKPSYFNPEMQYPLAYCIHDGPHECWTRSWRKRTWNLALFAEHGYVVVARNIAGSPGYGQSFTDATRRSFGGISLTDLQRGLEHIESELGYVDTTRAVALGYGYGGYLVNLVQGHELGRKFKALITDNEIFSMGSLLSSEEQHPMYYEMGEKYAWEDPEKWRMWDPMQYLGNWDTPHLIIHGKQNRWCPISDGLAAYRTLQLKKVECRLLTFSNEGHGLRKPENVLLWYRVVLDQMKRFTKKEDVP